MKLVNIQFGQAVRLFRVDGFAGSLYGPNLTRAFEARFAFLQGPRTVAEYDLSKGIVFFHGFFETIVIDKFSIFSDGIVCETKVNTAIADRFIDEALQWAREHAGFSIPPEVVSSGPRAYQSRLDIQADFALERAVSAFSNVGKSIASAISSYGRATPLNYGVSSVQLHVDNAGKVVTAGSFSFERLAGQPWEAGRYFSGAPLTTDDHFRMLEELELNLVSS